MHFLFLYFWIAPHALLLLAIAGFLRRRLHKRLPFFFTYLVFELFCFAVLVTVYFRWHALDRAHVSPLYYGILNCGIAAGLILVLASLYELTKELGLSRPPFVGHLRLTLRCALAVLVLVSAVVSALITRPDIDQLVSIFQTVDFSANLLKIGLLLVLAVFTRVLGFSWKGLPAGIALGFGVSAAAEMSASALLAELGKPAYVPIDVLRMAAFHLCVVIWLFYILRPQEHTNPKAKTSPEELEVWNQELGKMVRL
jgi:hypothetical protein